MAVIHLPAIKSLTLSNKLPAGNIQKRVIVIGNKRKRTYYSYLYFDTNMIPSNIALLSATLVLFRAAHFTYCSQPEFVIYPLLKEFSSFTTYLHDCPIDPVLGQAFSPSVNDAAIEVDITVLVNKWLDNSLINKGIAIKPITEEPGRAFWGSAYCKNKTLIPFIRIIYKHDHCYCLPISKITYNATVLSSSHK